VGDAPGEFRQVLVQERRAHLERHHHRRPVGLGEDVVLQVEARIELERAVTGCVAGRALPRRDRLFVESLGGHGLAKHIGDLARLERAQPGRVPHRRRI
jgi:hypothetical protein